MRRGRTPEELLVDEAVAVVVAPVAHVDLRRMDARTAVVAM